MKGQGSIRGLIRQSTWLLRIASLLVPKAQRREWYERRHTEVWHWAHFLQESGRLNSSTNRELARHVFGAFSDALWRRFDREKVQRLMCEVPRTPRFCLGLIAVVFLAVLAGSGFAPTVRWAFSSSPHVASNQLAAVSLDESVVRQHSDSVMLNLTRPTAKHRLLVQSHERQGVQIYLLITVLAFIGGLVLLAFRAARSTSTGVPVELRGKVRWWLFFAGKTALLLATCFLLSLEGTRRVFLASTGEIPSYAGAVSSWFLLVTSLLALTWALHDQGRRCHICLKRLSYESYVGVPARMLLDWWGTELVCSEGHGMLHVPEMKASWLEEEHWIPLDDSWKSLFEPENVNVP